MNIFNRLFDPLKDPTTVDSLHTPENIKQFAFFRILRCSLVSMISRTEGCVYITTYHSHLYQVAKNAPQTRGVSVTGTELGITTHQ
jgi:hypothetical protein